MKKMLTCFKVYGTGNRSYNINDTFTEKIQTSSAPKYVHLQGWSLKFKAGPMTKINYLMCQIQIKLSKHYASPNSS